MQHDTQRERTQSTNSITQALAFENKTHNPPTQTHKRLHSKTRHVARHTAGENSITQALAFENKTLSTTHNKRTQSTNSITKRLHSRTRHTTNQLKHTSACIRKQNTENDTQQERIQSTNSNTLAHRGDLYNNINNNRKHQFPRLIILTPDGDHIGRTCSDKFLK
jgi:hypothetical protein